MKIVYCDRCKRNVNDVWKEHVTHGAVSHSYIIKESSSCYVYEKNIDLCAECTEDLFNWIHIEKE